MRHAHTITLVLFALAGLAGLTSMGGCQTDKHAMSGAQPGVKPVCRECYELATQYRQWYPSRSYNAGTFQWCVEQWRRRWVPHRCRSGPPVPGLPDGRVVLHRERRSEDQMRQVRARRSGVRPLRTSQVTHPQTTLHATVPRRNPSNLNRSLQGTPP